MKRPTKRACIAAMAVAASAVACAEWIDGSTATTAAENFLKTSAMAERTLPDRAVASVSSRGSLWVVALSPSGHILLSGSDRATPIVGFSTNDFSEGEEDSAERAMLDAADAAVAAAEADGTKARHARWDGLLSAGSAKKTMRTRAGTTEICIEPFVDSKYNQNQPWNDLTPVTSKDSDYIWRGRSCAGCVSIADAAIFRELQWPKYPARIETVTHNLRGENFAIRFNGSVPFDWSKMYDTYSYSGDMRGKAGAEEDKRYEIGRYVLWLNQSASMSYNVGESTSTKYNSAHGSERDWYTIGQSMSASDEAVEEKVTGILEAGIPVFVGIGGHAVVADGWQNEGSDPYVHLVYGYGGNASDTFYSLATGPAQDFWVDHYPRAKPQLDPIPRVVGNSVTLSWHFPECYAAADKLYMFYITGKRRTSNEVVDWTADFSNLDSTGSAYPTGIWSTYTFDNEDKKVTLNAGDLTYGMYQFSTPLTVTASSVLSLKMRGGANTSGDANKHNIVIEICGEDGNWQELLVPECTWANWPGSWTESTKSLAEYAGQTVQLRIYKRHATYNGRVNIGDFKVTNVIPLNGDSVFQMAAATDRSAIINGLVDGADYYFSVTPYVVGTPVDAEPSDAKITTCSSGASSTMPELITSIQYAANGAARADLVDGYLADGSIGSSTLYVTTPTTVTSLTATPSHVELVKDENVHVTETSAGNWEIAFDPVIPANRDRQRMILTLHATDTNGTTVHRDVVMRMTEDKIVVWEGETWTLDEPYELTRSLVMAGGTLRADDTFAINQNSISSFTVVSNSTINGAGSLCISNSNATITFEDSKTLTNSLNIESAGQETLTLAGTGTFVQGAGTTIKVYDMSVGEHVLLNLNLTSDQSTSEAIVQFGNGMAAIADWKLRINAPTDMPKGTYPLMYAATYLSKPTTIYLPNLDRECSVEVKNSNTLNFVVGDPKAEQVTDTDYPVPYSWFTDMGVPEGYIDTLKTSATSSGYKWWECYVLGLNPMGSGTFTATLTMDGNTPVIAYSPTNETLVADATMPISYVLQGNASAEGDEWVDTSFDNPGSSYVRFRVDVRWSNGEVKHIYSNEVDKPAATPVAKIGDTTYTSLAAAVEDATEDNTVTLLIDTNETLDIPGTTTVNLSENGHTFGSLTGTGTLGISGALPSEALKTKLQNENNWKGTFSLSGYTTKMNNFSFNWWGNSNSVVRVDGINGYAGYVGGSGGTSYIAQLRGLEIFGDGVELNDSFAQTLVYIEAPVSGSGKLAIKTKNSKASADIGSKFIFTGDMSNYTGEIDCSKDSSNGANCSTVVFLGKDSNGNYDVVPMATAKGQIWVTEDADVTIKGAWTPTTAGGVIIKGKVTMESTAIITGNVKLEATGASLTAKSGATVSKPATTIANHDVKTETVDGNTVYTVAEKTSATDYPVPYSWFLDYGVEAENVEATATSLATNGVNTWWQCYVLGLDPKGDDTFLTTIRMDGSTPVVEFAPTNETLRASGGIDYVLEGRMSLTNDWSACDSLDLPGDTNRFFRVKVVW